MRLSSVVCFISLNGINFSVHFQLRDRSLFMEGGGGEFFLF